MTSTAAAPARSERTTGVRLAIVGSVRFADGRTAWPWVERTIRAAIEWLRPDVIISGGAPGVDTKARTIAAEYGYTVENGRFIEHLPAVRSWGAPGGFRDRNVEVAMDGTHLLALRCPQSSTYGSGWTADYAERHGREVYRRMAP